MRTKNKLPKQKDPSLKGMGLHWRLFFGFVTTSLVPVSIIAILVYNSLFTGLEEIQRARVNDALTRTLYGLDQEGEQLASNVQDYAHWDEMFYEETGRDPEWLSINITEWIPEQFDVDMIILADRDGSVYYQYQAPEELSRDVTDFPPFMKAFEGIETQEFYASSDGLMIVTAAYVSSSDVNNRPQPQDAPAVLMYGRYLDTSVAQSLSESVGGEIFFFDETTILGTSESLNQDLVGSPWQQYFSAVQTAFTSPESVINEETDTTAAFSKLIDVFGRPVGVVSVTLNKTTVNFVRAQFLTNILASLFISIILASALGLLLGWQLTESIRRLSRAVRDYAAGHISHAPVVDRSDEIGLLQQAFSDMVASLEMAKTNLLQHQNELKKSNEQLRRNSRDLQQTQRVLEERVNELKQLNEVMVGRELRMSELKKEIRKLSKPTADPEGKKRKRV